MTYELKWPSHRLSPDIPYGATYGIMATPKIPEWYKKGGPADNPNYLPLVDIVPVKPKSPSRASRRRTPVPDQPKQASPRRGRRASAATGRG